MRAHEDDVGLWQLLSDAPRQINAVEARHDQVRDYDGRPFTPYDDKSFLAIGGRSHDRHRVSHCGEENADSNAEILIVIGYDDLR